MDPKKLYGDLKGELREQEQRILELETQLARQASETRAAEGRANALRRTVAAMRTEYASGVPERVAQATRLAARSALGTPRLGDASADRPPAVLPDDARQRTEKVAVEALEKELRMLDELSTGEPTDRTAYTAIKEASRKAAEEAMRMELDRFNAESRQLAQSYRERAATQNASQTAIAVQAAVTTTRQDKAAQIGRLQSQLVKQADDFKKRERELTEQVTAEFSRQTNAYQTAMNAVQAQLQQQTALVNKMALERARLLNELQILARPLVPMDAESGQQEPDSVPVPVPVEEVEESPASVPVVEVGRIVDQARALVQQHQQNYEVLRLRYNDLLRQRAPTRRIERLETTVGNVADEASAAAVVIGDAARPREVETATLRHTREDLRRAKEDLQHCRSELDGLKKELESKKKEEAAAPTAPPPPPTVVPVTPEDAALGSSKADATEKAVEVVSAEQKAAETRANQLAADLRAAEEKCANLSKQLDASRKAHSSAIDSLESARRDYTARIGDAKAKRAKITDDLKRATRERDKALETAQRLEQSLNQSRDEQLKLRQEEADSIRDNETKRWTAQIVRLRKRIDDTARELETQRAIVSKKDAELATQLADAKKLEEQLAALHDLVAKKERVLKEKELDVQDLRRLLKSNEEDWGRTQSELKAKSALVTNLEEECRALNASIANEKLSVDGQRGLVLDLERKLAAALAQEPVVVVDETALNAQREIVSKQQELLKAREAELGKSAATIQKLQGELEAGRKMNEELAETLKTKTGLEVDLRVQLEAVAKEIATREQRLKDELVVSSTLRGRLDDAQNDLRAARAKEVELVSALEATKTAVEAKTQQVRSLRKELVAAKTGLDEAESKRNDMISKLATAGVELQLAKTQRAMAEQSALESLRAKEAALEAAERAAENVQTLAAELAASRTKADDLERQLAQKDTESVDTTRVAREDASRREKVLQDELALLRATEEDLRQQLVQKEAGADSEAAELAALRSELESKGAEETRLALAVQEKENELSSAREEVVALRAGTESALQRVASLSNEMDQIQLDLEAQRSDHRQAVERLQAEFEAKEAAALARVQQAEKQVQEARKDSELQIQRLMEGKTREVAEYGRRLAETSSQLDSVRQQLGRAQAETRKAVAMAQAARESEARAFQQAEEARQRATEDMRNLRSRLEQLLGLRHPNAESTGPGADERLAEDEKDGGVGQADNTSPTVEMDDAERVSRHSVDEAKEEAERASQHSMDEVKGEVSANNPYWWSMRLLTSLSAVYSIEAVSRPPPRVTTMDKKARSLAHTDLVAFLRDMHMVS